MRFRPFAAFIVSASLLFSCGNNPDACFCSCGESESIVSIETMDPFDAVYELYRQEYLPHERFAFYSIFLNSDGTYSQQWQFESSSEIKEASGSYQIVKDEVVGYSIRNSIHFSSKIVPEDSFKGYHGNLEFYQDGAEIRYVSMAVPPPDSPNDGFETVYFRRVLQT